MHNCVKKINIRERRQTNKRKEKSHIHAYPETPSNIDITRITHTHTHTLTCQSAHAPSHTKHKDYKIIARALTSSEILSAPNIRQTTAEILSLPTSVFVVLRMPTAVSVCVHLLLSVSGSHLCTSHPLLVPLPLHHPVIREKTGKEKT